MEPADPAAPPGARTADGSGELPPVLREVTALTSSSSSSDSADEDAPEVPAIRRVASDTERLMERDFAQLSPDELSRLAVLMRELTIAVPPRKTRRYRPRKEGARLDMRRTMRLATRTAGEPVTIARRAVRVRPRRLIVLCDISGSMEPYARALLQLMYVAARGGTRVAGAAFPGDASRPGTEVFTFATRLTRLTPFLSAASPETMLAKAGEAAPDWAGRHQDRRHAARVQRPLRGPRHGTWRRRADHLRRLGDRGPRRARRADGAAAPDRLPDSVGEPADAELQVQPRGRRHGGCLAVLRRRGQRAQLRGARRPARGASRPGGATAADRAGEAGPAAVAPAAPASGPPPMSLPITGSLSRRWSARP